MKRTLPHRWRLPASVMPAGRVACATSGAEALLARQAWPPVARSSRPAPQPSLSRTASDWDSNAEARRLFRCGLPKHRALRRSSEPEHCMVNRVDVSSHASEVLIRRDTPAVLLEHSSHRASTVALTFSDAF
jgi:hypothetical protein